MNTLEDRVRAATRAAADTVPPDSVPPLRLPSADPAGDGRWRSVFSSLWARRLAPLAAALAVVAVAVTMVMVGQTAREASSGPGSGTSGPGPLKAGPPISSYVAAGEVPRYYVSIEARGGNPNFSPSYAVVRATATGAALATVQPSVTHGAVVAVTAAADDQTFVLDEQPWVPPGSNANQAFEPRTFYMFRLDSSGRPGSLTQLPMSVPAGEMLTGFALSPDGGRLALAVQPDNVKKDPNLQEIRLYTLATGAVRTWSADGGIGFGGDDARSLSWADDERTLAFDWAAAGLGVHTSVWLLDTATGGANLMADSRPAVTLANQPLPFVVPTTVRSGGTPVAVSASGLALASPSASASWLVSPSASASALPPVSVSASLSVGPTPVPSVSVPYIAPSGGAAPSLACQEDSIITPDGSAIVCGAIETLKTTEKTSHGRFSLLSDVETGFVEYSTATGKITHILGHWRFDNVASEVIDVLWSSDSGSVVIGVIPSASGYGRVGVISGNEFTPLRTQAASVSPDSGTW